MKKLYNTPLVEVMTMTSVATICTTSSGGDDSTPGFEIIEGSIGFPGE